MPPLSLRCTLRHGIVAQVLIASLVGVLTGCKAKCSQVEAEYKQLLAPGTSEVRLTEVLDSLSFIPRSDMMATGEEKLDSFHLTMINDQECSTGMISMADGFLLDITLDSTRLVKTLDLSTFWRGP
jgi:hypothetical protein